jgi:hypothetical protein
MRYYTFEIVVEKEAEDDGYMAYSPTLPGCLSNGKTTKLPNATFGKPSSSTFNLSWRRGSSSLKMRSWSMSKN